MRVLCLIKMLLLSCLPIGLADSSRVYEVKKADISDKVTITGTAVPKQMASVYAPYDGYIKNVFPKVGDIVKTNQPLLKLAESLAASDVFPLRSPISGVVTQITQQVGSFVRKSSGSSSPPLMQIANLDDFYLEALVPEIDINKINKDMAAVASFSAILTKKYKAKITEVSISPKDSDNWSDRGKTQYPIRLKITNPDGDLRPGLSCVIDIIVNEKKDVLALPHEFVEIENSEHFVQLENGKRQKIEIGIQNDFLVEVKSGLSTSAKVRQVDFLKKTDSN